MKAPLPAGAVRAILDGQEQFLRFLQARTGSRAAAEDILQSSLVKALERGGSVRAEESAVAWFYRVLRNAVADHHRGAARASRAARARAEELPSDLQGHPEVERAVCRCLRRLLPSLKPEYARMLDQVDLGGASVAEAAEREGVTPNNAMVRLHRARKALQGRLVQACGACTEHGCLDCHCRQDP